MTAITHDMLPQMIQSEIVAGKRLEYRDDDKAILKSGKRVNHVLHLILSLFIPLWWILWLSFGFTGGIVTTHLQRVGDGTVQTTSTREGFPTWVKVFWIVVGLLWAVVFVALLS
jgi:hypothetical protein